MVSVFRGGTPLARSVLVSLLQRRAVLRYVTLALAAARVVAGCRNTDPFIARVADLGSAPDSMYQWIPLAPGENSWATDLNNHNQVVGVATHGAFLWQYGVKQDLGTLGGATSWPTDINERGQIVGWANAADGSLHAFFWENGAMQDLGPVAERSPVHDYYGPMQQYWHLVQINDVGQVIGNRPGGETFLWENGATQELPLAAAAAINNRGQVVGWVMEPESTGTPKRRAALWANGAVTELGTLGGDESWAVAITANGWVTGSSRTDVRLFRGYPTREILPFRWRGGVLEDLGNPCCETEWFGLFVNTQGLVAARDPTAPVIVVWADGAWHNTHPNSRAEGMDSGGEITGASYSCEASYSRTRQAFVWSGGVMRCLGSGEGFAINNAGVVAGMAPQRPDSTAAWSAAIWVPASTTLVLR